MQQVRRPKRRRAPELEGTAAAADCAALWLNHHDPLTRGYHPKPDGTLRTVTAPTEKLAITRAAELFHIAPARQNRIIVTKISDKDGD
jgi:hypothetical protein